MSEGFLPFLLSAVQKGLTNVCFKTCVSPFTLARPEVVHGITIRNSVVSSQSALASREAVDTSQESPGIHVKKSVWVFPALI